MALIIQTDIPMLETRGRSPSEEHVALLTMKIGQSFVSGKSRESLYQMARTLGVKVKILNEGNGEWRVWKRSDPGEKLVTHNPLRNRFKKGKRDGKTVDKKSD